MEANYPYAWRKQHSEAIPGLSWTNEREDLHERDQLGEFGPGSRLTLCLTSSAQRKVKNSRGLGHGCLTSDLWGLRHHCRTVRPPGSTCNCTLTSHITSQSAQVCRHDQRPGCGSPGPLSGPVCSTISTQSVRWEIVSPLLVFLSHIRPPYFSSGENQQGVQAALCKYPVLELITSTTTVAQEKIGSQCLYFSSPFQPWGITETWEEVSNISLSNYPVTRVIYWYLGLQRLLWCCSLLSREASICKPNIWE